MDNWFKSKWFVRAVSLAFAILLYVFVNIEVSTSQTDSRVPGGTEEMQTINDVAVDIRIDSDRFVVSGVPEYVSVTLEGMNSILTPIIVQRNFDVFVDLQDLGEGTHMVDIEYARVPDGLSVYIEPKTIEVTIEERASQEFAVTADFVNMDKLPDGYELGEPVINPGTVIITSSKSVIDQIAMVRAYIDVTGLTESINNREIPVNVYDGQGNELNVRIEPENIVASVAVDNPSKVVPVEISTTGELAEEYSLTSITADVEEVEVFATNQALSEIDKLTTEDIDLSKIKESGTINTKLSLPDGAAVGENNVKVTIELEQTKVMDELPIEVDEADERTISFLNPDNPQMKVTLIGDQSLIGTLTEEDIRLYIDTKDLDEGEHEVAVQIDGPEDVEIEVEFEKVSIEIK